MESLISTFHIDAKLLIAQIINFSIVVGVLYKFAYNPLVKKMNERADIIQRGLDDAKKAQEQLDKAEKTRDEKIIDAKKEARLVLEEAKRVAEKNKEEIIVKAKEEADKVVAAAREQIQDEKDRMIREVKAEIGGLVMVATEKILSQKIEQEGDRKIVEEVVQSIKG